MRHRENDWNRWDDRDRERRSWQRGWSSDRDWEHDENTRRWRQEDDDRSYRQGRVGMSKGDRWRRYQEDYDRGDYGYEGHFDTPRYGDYGQGRGQMHRYDPDYGGGYNRQQGRRGQDYDWDRGYNQGRMGQDWDRDQPRYNQDWRQSRGQMGRRGREHYNQDWNRGQGRYQGDWERGYDQGRMGRDWNRYDQGLEYGMDWDVDYEIYEDYEDVPMWTYTEMWWIPGPMSGLGPRNYERSDERICEDVCERLTRHGRLDASDIEVEVNHGEVTLQGTVNSQEEKRIAEDAIASIPGVMDIHNRLQRTRHQAELDEGRGQIRKGMEVVGSDNQRIGSVKKIRSRDFLVDRPLGRDIYVPFDACQEADHQRIKLGVPSNEIDQQNWEQPELIETPRLGGDREQNR
jgi:hypothetical protein